MYKARIDTDHGRTAHFSREAGVIFDIDPLSGVDVDISKSQGFQQLGESVETQSVGGITRTISGVVTSDAVANSLLIALPALTKGKLWFNDRYYCEIFINHSPEFHKDKNGRIRFTMSVFCPVPFWFTGTETRTEITRYTASFQFPVIYDEHSFGEQTVGTMLNIRNTGAVDAPLSALFSTRQEVHNYSISNFVTGETLKINDTLTLGQTVKVFQENGRIRVLKQLADGTTQNIFALLDDDSNLFWIHSGDNYIEKSAESGADDLNISVAFNTPHMGVLA